MGNFFWWRDRIGSESKSRRARRTSWKIKLPSLSYITTVHLSLIISRKPFKINCMHTQTTTTTTAQRRKTPPLFYFKIKNVMRRPRSFRARAIFLRYFAVEEYFRNIGTDGRVERKLHDNNILASYFKHYHILALWHLCDVITRMPWSRILGRFTRFMAAVGQ